LRAAWVVIGVGSLGPFVGQLDASAVQVGLPTLAARFDRSITTIDLVAVVYLLAYAAPLPIFDRLSERYGRRTMFMTGAAVEATGLVLCGTAPSMQWLLVFRVVQGLGASVVGANNLAIITSSVDGELRTRALGVFAAAQAIGLAVGVGFGGPLITAFGWRAAFWITAPFAVLKLLGGRLLPDTGRGDPSVTFDTLGALQLAAAMIGFLLVIQGLEDLTRPTRWGAAIVATVALLLFVRRSRKVSVPLLNPTVFRRRSYSLGLAGFALIYASLAATFVLGSVAFQRSAGDSAARAGLQLMVLPLALTVAAACSAGPIARLGAVRVAHRASAVGTAALVALAVICLAGIHRWLAPSSVVLRVGVVVSLAVLGAAFGLLITANNASALAGIPAASSGQAASWLNVGRVYGSSLGVALSVAAMAIGQAVVTGNLPTWLDLGGAPLLRSVIGGLVVVGVLMLAGSALTTAPRPDEADRNLPPRAGTTS
jgi:MFS family permease